MGGFRYLLRHYDRLRSVASVDAAAMNVLNKITNSRSALLLDTTFNVRTLSTFTEDGRQRMIEALEKELEQLKGIEKGGM